MPLCLLQQNTNMKSYYVTTDPGADEHHEVHQVGCHHLPIKRRYIGEFNNSEEAVVHVRYSYPTATNCRHCSGMTLLFTVFSHRSAMSRKNIPE